MFMFICKTPSPCRLKHFLVKGNNMWLVVVEDTQEAGQDSTLYPR
jgi:hypothetical protein